MEQREERTGKGAMRNNSIMREKNRKTMRNTSVLFYFSYIIYLIINALFRKYENMRNEFDESVFLPICL